MKWVPRESILDVIQFGVQEEIVQKEWCHWVVDVFDVIIRHIDIETRFTTILGRLETRRLVTLKKDRDWLLRLHYPKTRKNMSSLVFLLT